MKIISKFHDYYDSGQSFGYDPTTLYVRDQKEIRVPLKDEFNRGKDFLITSIRFGLGVHPDNKQPGSVEDYARVSIVGICGELHIALSINSEHGDRPIFIYSPKELLEYTKDHKIPKSERHSLLGRKYVSEDRLLLGKSESELSAYFNVERYQYLKSIFLEYGIPCFYIRHYSNTYQDQYDTIKGTKYCMRSTILNPRLKDLQTYKLFNSYEMYQNIAMYISGVLGGASPPMVSVTDKTKILKHGFDYKKSFRKEKESKS